ncbi:MAG: glycosyltransferase, partial [Actinomycetota bacterium]|nr:glycosyltransferase [Actinomycetota bacterium]
MSDSLPPAPSTHVDGFDPSPLRIGIIASSEHPVGEPFPGGMESHTATLAAGLRARGHEAIIHAATTRDGPDRAPIEQHPLHLSRAATSDVSMPSMRFMREHHAFLSLMLRIDRFGYDVIHNNSLHYLPVAMGPALRTPLVTTLHTPPTPWLESAIAMNDETA